MRVSQINSVSKIEAPLPSGKSGPVKCDHYSTCAMHRHTFQFYIIKTLPFTVPQPGGGPPIVILCKHTCFPSPESLYGSLKSVHVILRGVVISGAVFYYVYFLFMKCISLRVSSSCSEQCMSIAVGSVCLRGHWTMKGVVSKGSQCGGTLGWSVGARRHYICKSREYFCGWEKNCVYEDDTYVCSLEFRGCLLARGCHGEIYFGCRRFPLRRICSQSLSSCYLMVN